MKDIDGIKKDIESQFSQGNKNAYGEPYAFINAGSLSFDVIYEEDNLRFSATIYDKDGNPQLPYVNGNSIGDLIDAIFTEE